MRRILIAGVIVFIGGVVAVGVTMGNKGDLTELGITEGSEYSISGSLKDVLSGSLGHDIMCDYYQEIAESGELNMQTYISGNRFRVDYEMSGSFADQNAEQKTLHMVSDGEYAYVWGDSLVGGVMSGMKYKIEYDEDGNFESNDSGMFEGYMTDMPDMHCRSWNPNEESFEIPDDVEFMDLDGIGSTFMQEDSFGTQDACSACDMLTGDMKTSCLESMECE